MSSPFPPAWPPSRCGHPFIPGLRDIPRWIPVHRLIWRNWEPAHAGAEGSPISPAAVTHADNTATPG